MASTTLSSDRILAMVRFPARILVAGAGYVGVYAALALHRQLAPHEASITIVNPDNFMLYQPLLPEVASGNLSPRHAVVPLRKILPRAHLIRGRLAGLDHDKQSATIAPLDSDPWETAYDHVVLGLGSVTRVLPIPGLRERAVGFRSIAEALYLRNHILERMDVAESTSDPDVRRRALTFVFVGGGYTGVEALAELEDMASAASRFYQRVRPEDMRWILVEATDRLLPTVASGLASYAFKELRERGIEVHLQTLLERVEGKRLRLSTGEQLESDTLVWVAGAAPNPLIRELGLPTSEGGLLDVDEYLRVRGHEGAWAAGDGATVPDLVEGGTTPPTAQYAQREGTQLGANIVHSLRGEPLTAFRYHSRGEMITLGRRKGIARIFGRQLRGALPWLLRRGYYLREIPSTSTRAAMLAEWLVRMPFRRDVVGVGALTHAGQALQADETGELSADTEPGEPSADTA